LTCGHLKKLKKKHEVTRVHLKKSKKPQSDMWQSLFMVVNDLDSVSKKDLIEQN